MGLIYEDNPVRFSGAGFNPAKCDATAQALKHFENTLHLSFFLANGNTREKHQASKELAVAQRKIAWWQRQPNYDQAAYLRGCEAAKRKWRR